MQTPRADPAFAAVVALKPNVAAKSRLATLPEQLRRRLAWAMAVDTLSALTQACGEVAVVGSRDDLAGPLRSAALEVLLIEESGGGLNAALSQGATALAARGWEEVIACVGDLPALRAESVRAVATVVGRGMRGFVPDRSGIGTTMVITHGVALDPRFQGTSAAAHEQSGARPLTAAADARCDVDTLDDLAEAVRLGAGPQTRAVLDSDHELVRRLRGIDSTG